MEEGSESPKQPGAETGPQEVKEMYTHTIMCAPESGYTLEHRRQTPPEDRKSIYCVRFDLEECKFLAIGT
jgi:hypothetical protein